MSCIFCMYFSSCGGMGDICDHFRLRDSRKNNSTNRLRLKSTSISEAAETLNMTVTDFLTYIGELEKEGKLKIKFF